MTAAEHIELQTVTPGMPVILGEREIGDIEEVIPQPDHRHILRFIVREHSRNRRLIAIPIEWVGAVRDGHIELVVTERELRELPEYIPPARPKRRDHFAPPAGQQNSLGYGYPWLHTLLERATGYDFDDEQLALIEDLAERKLVDLFDVAEEAATMNGRTRVLRQDLPLTKGLQLLLLEVADLAREFELKPLLVFLSDAGIRATIDEGLRSEIPRLMAALLILTGRVLDVLEPAADRPSVMRPTGRELARASELLDLTL